MFRLNELKVFLYISNFIFCNTLNNSMNTYPVIIAVVVASAGMILPAMSLVLNNVHVWMD